MSVSRNIYFIANDSDKEVEVNYAHPPPPPAGKISAPAIWGTKYGT
jgi:hypothetical protein